MYSNLNVELQSSFLKNNILSGLEERKLCLRTLNTRYVFQENKLAPFWNYIYLYENL